jgi:hypothetical protein
MAPFPMIPGGRWPVYPVLLSHSSVFFIGASYLLKKGGFLIIASRGTRYSGKGRVQEPPSSLPMVAASQQRYLAYRVERDEHQRDQPSQDHYADDDRIDISMDSLEHIPLTHLSSACTDGCSASSCVV